MFTYLNIATGSQFFLAATLTDSCRPLHISRTAGTITAAAAATVPDRWLQGSALNWVAVKELKLNYHNGYI